MWEFYLCGSELSFRRDGGMVFQIQLAHDQSAVPLTRDYIGTAEQALVGRSRSSALTGRSDT